MNKLLEDFKEKCFNEMEEDLKFQKRVEDLLIDQQKYQKDLVAYFLINKQ